jgi:hypothetical protein
MLRLALVLVGVTLLSACNMLMTKDPVFASAAGDGAPGMRPGVWGSDVGPDCNVDTTQPLAAWPACAGGFVVISDSKLGGYSAQADKPTTWTTTGYVLASGDPRVFQVLLSSQAGGNNVLTMPSVYVYAGLEPTKFDEQGRIVAGVSWPVLCGPPPPSDAKTADGSPQMGTLAPLPGLTMDDGHTNCSTTSAEAVRGAAKASRDFAKPTDLTRSHWVRDGDK